MAPPTPDPASPPETTTAPPALPEDPASIMTRPPGLTPSTLSPTAATISPALPAIPSPEVMRTSPPTPPLPDETESSPPLPADASPAATITLPPPTSPLPTAMLMFPVKAPVDDPVIKLRLPLSDPEASPEEISIAPDIPGATLALEEIETLPLFPAAEPPETRDTLPPSPAPVSPPLITALPPLVPPTPPCILTVPPAEREDPASISTFPPAEVPSLADPELILMLEPSPRALDPPTREIPPAFAPASLVPIAKAPEFATSELPLVISTSPDEAPTACPELTRTAPVSLVAGALTQLPEEAVVIFTSPLPAALLASILNRLC